MNKKTFRNTAITTMAATATVAAVAPAAAADEASFNDLSTENEHYDAIMDLVGQGAIDGDNEGNFNPFEDIYRGQVAKILTTALNLETPENMDEVLSNYDDVDVNDQYAEEIAAVTAANVFGGTDDNQFNTWEGITREQMATVLVKAYDLNDYDAEEVELNKENISAAHVDSVQKLVDLGISENPSDFNAWDNIQRDQFSSFVVRTQDYVAEQAEPTVESVSAINATTVEVQFEGQEEPVEVELDSELEDGATTVSFEYDGHTYEDVELAEEFTVEPAVESVSAINNKGVEVKVEPVDEDRFDETIEVTDNNGNQVEVKPATIAAGEDTVYFEFADEVDSQEGVWTVGGVEYDFDLADNLEAFEEAGNQLELNEALKDLDVDNVKEENIAVYNTEKADFINNLEGDLTTEKIQEWIDEVNASELDDEESAAIAEEVTDAIEDNNDIALKYALNDSAFSRVNNDWLTGDSSYKSKLTSDNSQETPVDVSSVEEIQNLINGFNNDKLDSKVNDKGGLESSVDKEELNEAKELLNSYATPDEDGNVTETTQGLLDTIDKQLAVADVLDAPTANTFKSALTDLADKANTEDETVIDLDTVNDTLLKQYVEKVNEDITTAVAIQEKVIDAVNDSYNNNLRAGDIVAMDSSYTGYAVNFYIENDKKAEDIKNVDVKLYQNDKVAATMTSTNKLKENATVSGDTYKFTAPFVIEEKEGSYDVSKDENWTYSGWDGSLDAPSKAEVVVTFNDGATVTKTVEDFVHNNDGQDNLDDLVDEKYVDSINSAESATEVKTALDNLAIDSYVNKVPSADKVYVAEQVLDARSEETDASYEDVDAIGTALNGDENKQGIVDNYIDTVDSFSSNEIVGTDEDAVSIKEVVQKLNSLNYDTFDNLSAGNKTKVAEVIQQNYPETDDGSADNFRTLSAVKNAVDEAIDAPTPMSLN